MQLTNEFRVAIPVEQAWGVLTDVERIAPCMPGAELREVEGEEYRGVVKVKVGPVSAEYQGAAHFVERDDVGHRAVLRAEGRETKGQGNANATITAELQADGEGATQVSVVTDLVVSGKAAQFGRGVLADVSTKLINQFVTCLEATILGGDQPGAEGEAPDVGAQAEQADIAEQADTAGGAPDPEVAERAPAKAGRRAEEPPVMSGKGAGGDQGVGSTAEHNGVGTAANPVSSNGNANGSPVGARKVQVKVAEPVDLWQVAAPSVAKRVIPALIAALALALGGAFIWRRWRS